MSPTSSSSLALAPSQQTSAAAGLWDVEKPWSELLLVFDGLLSNLKGESVVASLLKHCWTSLLAQQCRTLLQARIGILDTLHAPKLTESNINSGCSFCQQ
jgi:hypothetical protein